MKRNQLVALLLILMLSFSITHSFVVEENHEHTDVHEWVAEISHQAHLDAEHDDSFHCEFHNSYIIPLNITSILDTLISLVPTFKSKLYAHFITYNLTRPPIA